MQRVSLVFILASAVALPACAIGGGTQQQHRDGDVSPDAPTFHDGAVPGECGNGLIDLGEQCDDGNVTDGDGCSATCQFENCSPSTCPTGCCDLQGNCVGGSEDTACGTGGGACASCTTAGQICHQQACEAPPACSPGDTLECGNCGTRVCDANGVYGPCQGEGACAAGASDSGAGCGNCGTLQRTCNTLCDWDPWTCTGEGVCSVGSVDTGGSCGNGGHEERTCQSDCTWGSYTCVGEGTCTPGATETGGSCGNCGTLQRTCDSSGSWGSWTCTGEGVCQAGTSETGGSCGDCGTQQRTCQSDCTWGNYTCTGEGVCSPGSTSTGSSCCTQYANYVQTCTNQCTWGASVCEGNTSCSVTSHLTCGEIDDPCTDPVGSWRCVYSAHWGTNVSQVCRAADASHPQNWWTNYHLNPQDCVGCCGGGSTACCQSGAACAF